MKFLHWLGGIIVFFWILGIVLRIAGGLLHMLIVAAVIVFIFDFVMGRRR
jgi:hypothetical protein